MVARRGWGKWARVSLLVSVGLYMGCGVVDAGPEPLPPAPPEVVPVTPEDVSPPTPGTPPAVEPPPVVTGPDGGSGGGGEQPDEQEPDTGSGDGGTQQPPMDPDPRRRWLRASFYAGVAPRGLAVGDFNGDGAPDVAINAEGRSFTSQYVSRTGEFLLLLNDGDGGLVRMTARRTLRGAADGRIVAGDAEGDGDLDVLLGTHYGSRLLLGNGKGAFSEQTFVTGGGRVSSLGFWSGGAGAPFLWSLGTEYWGAGPRTDAGFGLLRPLGAGGFESTFLQLENGGAVVGFTTSLSAAVADFNEDGFADVVFNSAPHESAEHAQVFFGNSTGRVRAGGALPWSGFQRVYTADFNQDGHADVLASDAHFVRVYLGNGRGDFSEASSVELEREVSDVAVVELGADAFPDVVALHGAAAAVSLLRGGGDGTLAMDSQLAVGRAPSSAATADLDGDGTQELLVVEEDDNAVSVYVIPDEPILELPISHWCPVRPFPYGSSSLPPVPPLAEVETGGAVLAPAVGDFDGDGRRDVALALPAQGVRLVLNPGGGTFTTRDVLQGYRVSSLAAGDFNGDGRSDLAGSLDESGSEHFVGVLWNDEEYPFEDRLVLGSSYGAGGVLAADFNRDGYVDLAASFQGWCVGRAARYTNQGDGTFRATGLTDYNFEPDDRCPMVGAPLAGDFNGDGTLDLLHDTLGLNLNPTAADGSTLPGYGFGGGGANLGLSDVDGDGRVDLVQRDHSSGGVWLHVGDGHGSLKFPVQCTPPVGDKTLALEDLDGDGVVDVAGTSSNGTELWVSLGEREGTWGSPRRYAPGGLVEWVKPVDLLGDERPEFLVLLRSGRLLVFPTPES